MNTRRDFLQRASLSSLSISSIGGITALSASNHNGVQNEISGSGNAGVEEPIRGWKISFKESSSELTISNSLVSINGQLNFVSDSKKWKVTTSRDGVPDRYTLVDPQNNVQGYIVFTQNGTRGQLKRWIRYSRSFR